MFNLRSPSIVHQGSSCIKHLISSENSQQFSTNFSFMAAECWDDLKLGSTFHLVSTVVVHLSPNVKINIIFDIWYIVVILMTANTRGACERAMDNY